VPLFVPEIKPIDSLLFEMRLKQSHLAIVVDEFTNVAGIVTLEMIIEQIIGEIDDEHDSIDGEHGVVEIQPRVFRVKGHCGLEQFNLLAKTDWHDDKVESVGGYIIKWLGRIPQTNETLHHDNYTIQVANADSRKINTLIISLAK
jgi:magnesium and cobalt transporter